MNLQFQLTLKGLGNLWKHRPIKEQISDTGIWVIVMGRLECRGLQGWDQFMPLDTCRPTPAMVVRSAQVLCEPQSQRRTMELVHMSNGVQNMGSLPTTA